MNIRIDRIEIKENELAIRGFAGGNNPEDLVQISIENESSKVERYKRADLNFIYYGKDVDAELGFKVKAKYNDILTITTDNEVRKIKINKYLLFKYATIEKIKENSLVRNILDYYRAKKEGKIPYAVYCKRIRPTTEEIKNQREEKIEESDPKFSILVPLYNTPVNFLKEMIESVINQTYEKWELCLADGSDDNHIGEIQKEVEKYNNEKIKYEKLEKNEGISENTNKALKMATGDFVVLFDHDDLLTCNALYEFAKVIKKDEECDCIYSDEDKVDEKGKRYYDPHFKPDYNIDMLCSENYICHLFAVRKKLTEKYGGFRAEYDGSQDHEFILRMTEQARKTIHVPKILYHWRVHSNSTAQDLENKMYCFESGRKAVKDYYGRKWPNLKIDHVEDGISLGIYHTIWKFNEYPLVSVIIPNKDHKEDLEKVIKSMEEKNTWPNIEYIIVENNSKKEETFAYYKKLQEENKRVRVVKYEGEFNYSRINNYGVKFAKGEYVLLMNNDVELIEPESVKEMVGYCQRADVGIVGSRLLYADGTIQHAGVVIGMTGVAGHVFKGQASEGDTYFNRAMVVQDYSAVTAAVMMVKKEVYEEVNGLDERYAVAFNDIDFCLRIRKKGKLVVYNPYSCFYHYESKSRGYETTPEKQERFQKEISMFVKEYEEIMKEGDPYYNPNLSLKFTDYQVKDVSSEGKLGTSFSPEQLKHYLDC